MYGLKRKLKLLKTCLVFHQPFDAEPEKRPVNHDNQGGHLTQIFLTFPKVVDPSLTRYIPFGAYDISNV